MRSPWRRTPAPEGGFTLMEVVTVTALMLLVVGSMLSLFNGMQRSAAREASRSETTDQVRVAMDRMTKEIRQATAIRAGSTPSYLDMDTYVNGTLKHVTYDATTPNILTRTVDGNTITLLDRMTITAVWSYSPSVTDPSVITVSVVAKPEKFSVDTTEISLDSEVTLRNRSTG